MLRGQQPVLHNRPANHPAHNTRKQSPSERNLHIVRAASPEQGSTNRVEIITDKDQQMERWVEHYSELHSTENTVSAAGLDGIECLLTVDELDSEPSVENSARPSTARRQAKPPGNEGISLT